MRVQSYRTGASCLCPAEGMRCHQQIPQVGTAAPFHRSGAGGQISRGGWAGGSVKLKTPSNHSTHSCDESSKGPTYTQYLHQSLHSWSLSQPLTVTMDRIPDLRAEFNSKA